MYVDGFKYWLAYRKGQVSYYRCRRYKANCPGRCVVELGQVRTTMAHSHPAEPDRILVERFRRILTQRAQKERTELYTIYWEEANRHSDASIIYTFTQAESCMRKARRKLPPQSCTTIRELSDILSTSSLFFITCGADKENLYKTTISTDDGTCLVFMHYKAMEKVGRVDEMHVDHRFKSEPAPPNFNYTILTMHAIEQKQSYPFLYAVMTVKTQSLYAALFSNLRENFGNVCPSNIFSNYDTDLMEALKFVFPEASIRGYYFHYTAAVLNKMKLLKISKQKGHISSALRMLLCLPLLPANYMRTGLQSIRKWLNEKQTMTPQFEYLCEFIEKNWLLRHGADKMSIFSLPHCVTNHIQTFNSELQSTLGVKNPIIWHTLEAITNIARQTFTKLTKRSKQLVASPLSSKTPKKGQIIQNTIITSATQQWIRTPVHLRNPLQFLQVTSHCINDALFSGTEDSIESTTQSISSNPTSPMIHTEIPSLTYTIQAMNSNSPPLTPPPLTPNPTPSTTTMLTSFSNIQSKPQTTMTTVSNVATTPEFYIQPQTSTAFYSEPPPLAYYRKAFLRKNIKCSEPPPLIFYKDMFANDGQAPS